MAGALTYKPPTATELAEFDLALGHSGLPKHQLNRAQELIKAIDVTSRQHLLQFAKSNGSLLSSRDSGGNTIFSHLSDLAIQTSDPTRGNDAKVALAEIISSLANPAGSTQDMHGACGPETLSCHFHNFLAPGEWVRASRGLLMDRRCTMPNGRVLELPADFKNKDGSLYRTELDARIHAAFMHSTAKERGEDPSIGGVVEYSNRWDTYFKRGTDENIGGGITSAQTRAIYKMFGVKAITVERAQPKSEEAVRFMLKIGATPFYGAIKWDGEQHAVLVTGVKEGRVQFRNPHGPSKTTPGAELKNPPRRMENPITGEESMEMRDFVARFESMLVPVAEIEKRLLKDPKLALEMFKFAETAFGADIILGPNCWPALPSVISAQAKASKEFRAQVIDFLKANKEAQNFAPHLLCGCATPEARSCLMELAKSGNQYSLLNLDVPEKQTVLIDLLKTNKLKELMALLTSAAAVKDAKGVPINSQMVSDARATAIILLYIDDVETRKAAAAHLLSDLNPNVRAEASRVQHLATNNPAGKVAWFPDRATRLLLGEAGLERPEFIRAYDEALRKKQL